MDFLDENVMVGSLVAKTPAYATLFEKVGIDYCCKGKRTLRELCLEKNLNPSEIVDQLKMISATPSHSQDGSELTLNDLMSHIRDRHHGYLKEELPRLSGLIYKVSSKHGGIHPELIELRETFEGFKAEMLRHIEKEETIVFPAIERFALDKNAFTLSEDSLKSHLSDLDSEHLAMGAALEKMNKLTNGYTPPAGACTTYHVMLNSLGVLEKDVREHLHKESHILFPQALKEYHSSAS